MKNLIVVSIVSFFAFCASLFTPEPKETYIYKSPVLDGTIKMRENYRDRVLSETNILNARTTVALDSLKNR